MAAIRAITRLRDADDVSVAGRLDGMGLVFDATAGLYRAAYPAAAKRCALVVEGNCSSNLGQGGFATIVDAGGRTLYDPGGNYGTATGIYTVPVTGLYLTTASLRVLDGSASYSYGQGVHTVNEDHPSFLWTQTVQGVAVDRNGAQYTRVVFLHAGDALRHYAYLEGPSGNAPATTFTVNLLYADPPAGTGTGTGTGTAGTGTTGTDNPATGTGTGNPPASGPAQSTGGGDLQDASLS